MIGAVALLFIGANERAGKILFAQNSALANCPDVLPRDVRARLQDQYSAWKIQEVSSLSSSARQSWMSNRDASRCPGISIGNFDGNGQSYAVLIRPLGSAGPGYRIIVFSQRRSNVQEMKIAEWNGHGAENYYIVRTKLNDPAWNRKFRVTVPDGVVLVDAAEDEYGLIAYFWATGQYHHQEWVDQR